MTRGELIEQIEDEMKRKSELQGTFRPLAEIAIKQMEFAVRQWKTIIYSAFNQPR